MGGGGVTGLGLRGCLGLGFKLGYIGIMLGLYRRNGEPNDGTENAT